MARETSSSADLMAARFNISYNLLFGNRINFRAEMWTDGVGAYFGPFEPRPGEGMLNDDPRLADPENGDYRLTADSPCIDAGDPDSPLDPDGTRADMVAFYFHQRDIAVEPRELHFPQIGWGAVDSLMITIFNEGGTDLHFTVKATIDDNCLSMGEFEGLPLVIEPNQSLDLWVYYSPREGVPRSKVFIITSDDPDESEILIEADGEVNGVVSSSLFPLSFNLYPCSPNPFNSSTTISYSLPQPDWTTLSAYDVAGRLVAIIDAGWRDVGEHQAVWNARGFPGGVYVLRLEGLKDVRTIKVVLVK